MLRQKLITKNEYFLTWKCGLENGGDSAQD